MKSAIGEKLTRKDHADVSNQLVSTRSHTGTDPSHILTPLIVRQVRHRPRRRLDEGRRW